MLHGTFSWFGKPRNLGFFHSCFHFLTVVSCASYIKSAVVLICKKSATCECMMVWLWKTCLPSLFWRSQRPHLSYSLLAMGVTKCRTLWDVQLYKVLPLKCKLVFCRKNTKGENPNDQQERENEKVARDKNLNTVK